MCKGSGPIGLKSNRHRRCFVAGLSDHWRLMRGLNATVGSLTVPIGAVVVGVPFDAPLTVLVILHAICVWLFMAAWNVFNDVMDVEGDLTNHPDRPIPSGVLSRAEARSIGKRLLFASFFTLLTAAGVASLWSGDIAAWLPSLPIWFLAFGLMFNYEFEGESSLRLKHKGLSGNLAVSLLVGLVIVFGAAAVGAAGDIRVWLVGLSAFAVNSAREIIKDIEDMQGDEGRTTLSQRIGPEKARIIAWLMTLVGMAAMFVPFVIRLFDPNLMLCMIPAILALSATKPRLYRGEDFAAQRSLRLAMMLGLFGFLAAALFTRFL